jgi:hypothetical protein
MPRKRTVETENDRQQRLEANRQKRSEVSAASDNEMDRMVKRSIEQHGA